MTKLVPDVALALDVLGGAVGMVEDAEVVVDDAVMAIGADPPVVVARAEARVVVGPVGLVLVVRVKTSIRSKIGLDQITNCAPRCGGGLLTMIFPQYWISDLTFGHNKVPHVRGGG